MVVGGDRLAVATARVLVDDDARGSAVLVDGRHLLTAWHGVQSYSPGHRPRVDVRFPLHQDGRDYPVTVLDLPAAAAVDLAVLDLGDHAVDLPPGPPLWASRRVPASVQVFGYPVAEGALTGIWRGFTVS